MKQRRRRIELNGATKERTVNASDKSRREVQLESHQEADSGGARKSGRKDGWGMERKKAGVRVRTGGGLKAGEGGEGVGNKPQQSEWALGEA